MDLFNDRTIPYKRQAEKRSRVGRVQPSHLERVLQPHQERKADRLQDPLLIQCVFYLLELDYLQVRERRKKWDKDRERQFPFWKNTDELYVLLFASCFRPT